MDRPNLKSADEQLVDDPAAAMQRTILATRQALAVPNSKIDATLARGLLPSFAEDVLGQSDQSRRTSKARS
jgi:hypothetical protein